MKDDYITAKDIVAKYGKFYTSAQAVYRAARDKKIPHYKRPGGRYVFSRSEIDEFVESFHNGVSTGPSKLVGKLK